MVRLFAFLLPQSKQTKNTRGAPRSIPSMNTGGVLGLCFRPSEGLTLQSSVSLHKLCLASFQRAKGESPPTGSYCCPRQPPQSHAAIPDCAVRQEIQKSWSRDPKGILFLCQSVSLGSSGAHGREQDIGRKMRDLL